MKGTISKITGPVVTAKNMPTAKMYNMVLVGNEQLLGEIIQLKDKSVIIQVYEDTSGLKPGEPVEDTKSPLSIELGPGLVSNMYDGIGRPLQSLATATGDFIGRGIQTSSINKEKKYLFTPIVKNNTLVKEGEILGEVKETDSIIHKILVPPGMKGKITNISKKELTVKDTLCSIDGTKITMTQKWPVRNMRPYIKKSSPTTPLITGRRVIDMFFPIAKGGSAAIPGPFGAGKTMTQQDIAKWCDADIIVYIGCGERGNEMTEVLTEFPQLIDPHTGNSLLNRTIMIANTSNMPVAAREASIYTGITIAEYYRDQGYNVALMADSTSRWAEAMREISTRLEEMPREEGYPAYLPSRLAQFYERAGTVTTLGNLQGSVTVIGAVSPQGGDFSEPVTHNTQRVTKVFWGLDASLAYKRHFPSINWLTSYSLYKDVIGTYYDENVQNDFTKIRDSAFKILQKESELKEIVQLIGQDALPEDQKGIMLVAKILREDFLQQNSLNKTDAFCSISKQTTMLKFIMEFSKEIQNLITKGLPVAKLVQMKTLQNMGHMKYSENLEKKIKTMQATLKSEIQSLGDIK